MPDFNMHYSNQNLGRYIENGNGKRIGATWDNDTLLFTYPFVVPSGIIDQAASGYLFLAFHCAIHVNHQNLYKRPQNKCIVGLMVPT